MSDRQGDIRPLRRATTLKIEWRNLWLVHQGDYGRSERIAFLFCALRCFVFSRLNLLWYLRILLGISALPANVILHSTGYWIVPKSSSSNHSRQTSFCWNLHTRRCSFSKCINFINSPANCRLSMESGFEDFCPEFVAWQLRPQYWAFAHTCKMITTILSGLPLSNVMVQLHRHGEFSYSPYHCSLICTT